MRVFVTGASGWIGSAVVPELIGAGHDVVGLARSDASANVLKAAGADVVLGSLDDVDLLQSAAVSSDAVVHLAFKHDLAFSGNFLGAAEADRDAINAFGDALAGSGKPFTIASGLLGVYPGHVATERDGHGASTSEHPFPGPSVRIANAQATLAFEQRDVRSSIVRLPPTVHGDGDNGFVPGLIAIARAKGVSGYIGDGASRWPAVHRFDAATLFRLAIEEAPAGSTLHAVGDEGVATREIAEVIGRHLDVPVVSITPEDAPEHFTWMASFFSLDSPASSQLTQQLLGWTPTHQGLIDDLNEGHYFTPAS
jgi:nucleoside-diphosphate-sugar epimerase